MNIIRRFCTAHTFALASVQKGCSSSQKRAHSENFSRWLLAIVFGFLLGSPLHAQVVSVWNGGTGNWSTATAWTPNGAPNSANSFVRIDNGNATASLVSVDGGFTIGQLTIDANDSLGVNNGQTLVVTDAGGFAGAGTITNLGSISLNSTTNFTDLWIVGNITLTGGGTVNLTNAARFVAGGTLTNVNNLIQGDTNTPGGSLGNGQTVIVNQASGLINANVSGKAFLVYPGGGGLSNAGTMEATNGGILEFTGSGGTITNTGAGKIQALTGSEVQLFTNAAITGGTLATTGTGVIRDMTGATLTDLTNSGTFIGANSTVTTLTGTITNTGSITLASTTQFTDIFVNGNVTLTGDGTITMANAARFVAGGT
ncbi:MAG TPA: hypothetical protein VF345_02680, partial [Chthoniobacterales bacterium]